MGRVASHGGRAGRGAAEADRLSYDPRSLKVMVYGWAALPPGCWPASSGCAATTSPMVGRGGGRGGPPGVAERMARDLRTAPEQNYVGIPNPLLESTVTDEMGAMLADQPGVPGEAVYRSPAITAGYYRDLPATEHAFRHGWFHSGDSCMYDGQGLRIMVDRFKDIVKTGGENVSSLRVEAVLSQHPGVRKAAVVGLPHERWGEAVTAIVVPDPAAPPGAAG